MIDPKIPFFPLASLAPQAVTPGKLNPVMFGPQPLEGAGQSVQSGAGRWKLTYETMRARGAGILAARAFLTRIAVPLSPAYVSPMDWLRSPRNLAGLPSNAAAATFSDGSLLSDGTRFVDGEPDFQLAAAVPAFATTIVAAPLTAGLQLQAGQIIGLDERMHEITGAWSDDSGVTANQTLTIWPPTRAAYAAGMAIESENPFCRMVLDRRDVEKALKLSWGRYGYVDLVFVEDDW